MPQNFYQSPEPAGAWAAAFPFEDEQPWMREQTYRFIPLHHLRRMSAASDPGLANLLFFLLLINEELELSDEVELRPSLRVSAAAGQALLSAAGAA